MLENSVPFPPGISLVFLALFLVMEFFLITPVDIPSDEGIEDF